MKIDSNDVKNGVVLEINGKLMKVIDHSHTHTGRGSGTYTFRVKDILTGGTQNVTYKANHSLEAADVSYNNAVFLYQAGESYSFMENDTGEMYELEGSVIDEAIPFMKENIDVFLIKHEGNVLGIILPQTIEYIVETTVPGIKGDRSSAGKKPATLENGLEVMIPLHVEQGATVSINTATGEVR